MSTYTAIAQALSTVPGVTGTEAAPPVLTPGAGWPKWTSAGPGPYGGLIDSWHVFVVLPNATLLTTVQAADPLVDAVWAALLDVGEVSLVEPDTLPQGDPATTGQGIPALRFTMTTAGDRS